uniref:Kh domain-containing protein n=1 Tax=Tetraselmis sp. GSL018 TaxID=582737 RepID=A0A061REL9_9CHLO
MLPVPTLKILIPSHETGKLVGKGGAVLNALRTETGASIELSESLKNCDERLLTVSSNWDDSGSNTRKDTVLAVLAKIGRTGEGHPNSLMTLRLLLCTSQTKSLIGKGGEKIQNIRLSSGARVRLLPKWEVPLCGSVKLDTVCQITGAPDKVRVAVENICDIIESSSLDDEPSQEVAPFLLSAQPAGIPILSSRKVSFCVLVPTEQVGQLIGRSGEVIQTIREATGATLHVSASEEGADYRCLEIVSTEAPSQTRSASLEALIRCLYCLNEEARPRAYSIRLIVPSRCATNIIGKGGTDIQALRNATKAIIRILDVGEGIPKLSCLPLLTGRVNLIHIEGPASGVHSALESVAAAVRLSAWAKDRQGSAQGMDGDQRGPMETVVMGLTRAQAGAVIGVSGTNINHIREMSGAKVTLKAPSEENASHELEIVGTAQQCQATKCMVNAFIWRSGMEPEPERTTSHHAMPAA